MPWRCSSSRSARNSVSHLPVAKVYSGIYKGTEWNTVRDVAGLASDFGVPESYVTDEHFVAVVMNGDLDASNAVVSGKVYDNYGLQVRCKSSFQYRVICTVVMI